MGQLSLVTGATGFIGSHVVRQLLAQGEEVRVFVRAPQRLDPSIRGRVAIVEGDIGDPVKMAEAVRGAGTVYHLAALAQAWSKDPDAFRRINVEAVERLLEAATAASVERFVHVSTILTLPPHRPAPGGRPDGEQTPYTASKRAGERLVEAYAESGRHAVIVHPSRVYGPGPLNDANGVVKMVDLYLRGRFRVRLADGDVLANYVHVEDAAAGVVLAAGAESGAHYVLGGPGNVSLADFLQLVARLSGVSRATVPLPRPVALMAGGAAELWGRLGGSAPLTRGWVRTFLEDRRQDIDPAREDLGYAPRSLEDGLAETLAWLRERHAANGSRPAGAR